MDSELKTSQEWYDILGSDYIILYPDGWDRKNYEESFNKELVTKNEYLNRVMRSTLLYRHQFGTWVPQ